MEGKYGTHNLEKSTAMIPRPLLLSYAFCKWTHRASDNLIWAQTFQHA